MVSNSPTITNAELIRLSCQNPELSLERNMELVHFGVRNFVVDALFSGYTGWSGQQLKAIEGLIMACHL